MPQHLRDCLDRYGKLWKEKPVKDMVLLAGCLGSYCTLNYCCLGLRIIVVALY